ncbi:amidohydrolase family protein [Candidatus Actinomarina]|nr:amidohydrolase family protein [Candidatus Actinomarina sp.]
MELDKDLRLDESQFQRINSLVQTRYIAKYVVQDVNTVHQDAALVVEDSLIKKIQKKSELSSDELRNTIDLGEVIISPGLTNAHSHVALNSVKGLGYGKASALYDVMWGVEPALDESSVYKLSLLGMVDAIRSGTTSINDHYFFANSVAKAASEIGIRGFIGHTVMTEYGPWVGKEEINKAKEFIIDWQESSIVHPIIAPHETSTVSPEILVELYEYAHEYSTAIHIHLAQTQKEMDFIKEKFETSPIKHASNLGILDKNVIAAHCKVVEEGDLEILSESSCFPIFCPTTHGLSGKPMNTNFLTKNKTEWGIGTDCSGGNDDYDMLEEMRAAILINNTHSDGNLITPKEIFDISTRLNISRISLNSLKGTLSEGQPADFISIDINNSRMQPLHDIINNIVMCASSKEIKDVFVNGNAVLRNDELVNIDEEKLIYEGKKTVDRIFNETGFTKRIQSGDFR